MALAGVVALGVLAVVMFPWDSLRGPLANYLSERTGRPVEIQRLAVRLGWHPWIELHGVSVGNAAWSDQPVMLSAERVEARIVPLSLLGRLRIPELRLQTPRVVLETNASGEGNWRVGKLAEGKPAELPLLGRLHVGAGQVRYRDPQLRADVMLDVASNDTPGEAEGVVFSGSGKFRGEGFRVKGRGDALGELRDVGAPFTLRFDATAGATRAAFEGTVVPNDPVNLRGAVQVSGRDMSDLHPLVPVAIPWTPPYSVAGHLEHAENRWKVTGLAGKVGRSDLTGTLTVEAGGPRRKVVADLKSERLDYRDLGGLVGLPPGKETTPRRAPEQKVVAQRMEREERIFSEQPFKLDRLREYDADVRFRGRSIRVDRVPMENVDMHIVIDDGVLRYDPVKIGIADGSMVLAGSLDARGEVPRVDLRLEGRNLDLARIFPELASPRAKAGRFGGYVNVKSAGGSIATMAAAAQGEGALLMAGGEASALALLLTNLDLAGAVPLVVGGDRTAALHCAVTLYGIDDGTIVPRLLVVDTSAVRIDGSGSIDLDNEQYQVTLQAKSKQFSIFALRGPIVIGGTLRDPTVAPTVGPIAARVGVAAGLAAIAPPLAILPFIDLGGTADADCQALLMGKPERAGG